MTGLTPFEYPDEAMQQWCELQAGEIRRVLVNTIHNISEIGRVLEAVQARLGALFYPWVNWHFGWSDQTVRNYINTTHLVDRNPKVLDLQHLTLVYQLPSLPTEVQSAIIEAQPRSLAAAKSIIDEYRACEWKEAVETSVAAAMGGIVNPEYKKQAQELLGDALQSIECAMSDEGLRETAKEVMQKYAPVFASLSDRSESGLQEEMGLSVTERLPTSNGQVSARLVNDSRVEVWIGDDVSEPVTIAEFPRNGSPVVLAHRNRAILAVCREFGIE